MSKSYTVYKNDLKFRKHRNINKSLSLFSDDDAEQHYDIDMDTIQYRLEEAKNNNYYMLDLSNLNLTSLPNLINNKYYNELKNIKCLFINDNNLTNIDDILNQFSNLEVIDTSNNKLKSINYLPKKITELSCHNNELSNICSSDSLLKLDCSFNQIETFSNYINLVDLLCDNNKITKLNTFNKINRIICKFNPLVYVETQKTMTYFDCSNTNLEKINNLPNIKHLLCNDTKISDISHLTSIETLEIINSKIDKIPLLPNLKQILYLSDQNIMLSSKYKIKEHITEKNHCFVIFEK